MFTALRRRVWLQFALTGMALLVLAAITLLVHHARWARERRAFLDREQAAWEARGAARHYIISEDSDYPASLLSLIGERGYRFVAITVDVATLADFTVVERDRLDEARRLFPEARIGAFYIDREAPEGMRMVSLDRSLDETSDLTTFLESVRSGKWW